MAWITEPGTQEQQRLEESVGEKVEHGRRIGTHPAAKNM
jgi:hypothetical protein